MDGGARVGSAPARPLPFHTGGTRSRASAHFRSRWSAPLPLGHPSTTLQSITTLRSSFARQATLLNFATIGCKITFGSFSNLAANGRQILLATGWQIAIGLANCGRDALLRVRSVPHGRDALPRVHRFSTREGRAPARPPRFGRAGARPSRMLAFFTCPRPPAYSRVISRGIFLKTMFIFLSSAASIRQMSA